MEELQQVGSRVRVSVSFQLHLILLLCIIPFVFGSTAFRNETDRLALLAFKDRISQDPFRSLNSWNDSLHFCEWVGITCSRRHQRVTVLNLQSRGLLGSIPPHMGNLTFLKQINLQNNTLQGPIPQELGRLFRLQHLNLGHNSFQSLIPPNLSHCSNLRLLYLNDNELVGNIPLELHHLTQVNVLGLGSNNLIGAFPAWIANFTSLRHLSLGRNNLEGPIPQAIGQISTLQSFTISFNKLSGEIPSGLYNQSSLYELGLVGNQFHSSFPSNMGFTLPNILSFCVSANRFTGSIPVSLTNASGLVNFDIGGNEIIGPLSVNLGQLKDLELLGLGGNQLGRSEANDLHFFDSLTNCSKLRILDIRDNGFQGTFPNSIANFSDKFVVMMIGGNAISGTIPSGFENLLGLSLFFAAPNFITGNIPIGLGKLPRLQEVDLSGNRFSGLIPSSLGNLTRLSRLSLQDNDLIGNIPSSLGNCQALEVLDLSQNNLSGNIPEQVFGLTFLSISLNLSRNYLIGSLSIKIGKLINVGELDISRNRLIGEIPSSLGDCLKLERLHMEGNFFQGLIPQSLSNLKGIRVLDLSSNNLSGRVPQYLERLAFLQNLNLSFNHFEGELPNEGVFGNASTISIGGNSKLCGGIAELRLPACHVMASKRQGMSLSIKIIIIVASLVIFLILLVISIVALYWKHKSGKRRSSLFSLEEQYQKVSYAELLQATSGFSSNNLIGIGSFGLVYKGILNPRGIIVAVKVLNFGRGALKSFKDECKALKNIRHRNLIKILTSCSSIDFKGNDFKALVFEYMPNGSLEGWLHSNVDGQQQQPKNLNLLQRLNIAIDVASALDYLHHHCQTPVVHCDVKPSNILLDNDMTAHVSDFGLAKLLAETSINSSCSTIAIKGTIGYVPPEYGINGEVSTQGDVYSYGILLLEMFTGKKPTNDMFRDGLNLYILAKMALPSRVLEIIDPLLLMEHDQDTNDKKERVLQCLISVVTIGVLCSAELPKERLDMGDVAKQLHVVRDSILGVGSYA